MATGLASFNARRNVRAPVITVSTIQGSSITTTSITTGTLSLSTLTGSTISAPSISVSSLTGSSMISNTLAISTLTVSSINNGTPGVAAYSTFNASSINTSSITVSSITTAPGYNSNIGNVLYTVSSITTGAMQVGIGTSTPLQTLSIYGTMSITSASGVSNSFFIKSSSTSTDFASMYFTNNTPVSSYMGLGGSGVVGNFQSNFFIQSPNAIILNTGGNQTSGSVGMYLSSTGNVCIGTASPLTSLTIQATTSSTGVGTSAYCGIHIIGGNTADYFNGITWSSNHSSSSTSTHAGILVQGSGSYGTKMRFYTSNYFLGGQYERMVIDNNGSVGIGTVSPSFLLHGYGNTDGGVVQYFQNENSGTGAWTLIGCRNDTSQLIMFLNSTTRTDDGGQSVGTIRNNAGSLRLQSYSANTAGNIFIVGTTGRVGVGKTDPSYLLDVNGGIQSNGTSKIVIQNSINGGTTAGIMYWTIGNTDWVSYMATSGGGTSALGGTGCTGAFGFVNHAIRNRVYNYDSGGFIWENSSETCLMSIRGNGSGGMIGSWGVNTLSPGTTLDVVGSIRTNDWYYLQGALGMYWTSYSRGIVSPEQAGNNYGNASTWGSARNTWAGWGAGSKTCFMNNGNQFGIHDNGSTWVLYCEGGSNRACTISGSVLCSQNWDRFVVYVNGYNYDGGYFYVNQGAGWGMISDERIKKNIQPIAEEPSTTFIKNLQPYIFCLKEETGKHKHCAADGTETGQVSYVCNCKQSGFIAQNVLAAAVQAGIPKSVCNNWYDYEQELGLPDEERKAFLGVSIVPVVSHLTNATKSLIGQYTSKATRITSCKSKLASMLSRLNALEAR